LQLRNECSQDKSRSWNLHPSIILKAVAVVVVVVVVVIECCFLLSFSVCAVSELAVTCFLLCYPIDHDDEEKSQYLDDF